MPPTPTPTPTPTGDFLSLLLLQSGDVETNPGPPRRAPGGGRGANKSDAGGGPSSKDGGDRRDSSVGMGERMIIDKASSFEFIFLLRQRRFIACLLFFLLLYSHVPKAFLVQQRFT